MIANEIAPIANSLWSATANPTPPCPPLTGAHDTEVAIVGGGFTGLSAALHLAERGVAVTLLEAETPGWGASGRNGGQVNPGLKEDPDTIERHFGPEMGGRMIRLAGGAADLVFDLVRRHNINCAAAQTGWIQPVHDAAARKVVQARVDQWNRRGAPLRMLSAQETEAMLGTSAYLCGMIDPRGGNLHPLNYALGLADAALKAGAVLHGHSKAIRIETDAGGHVVHTAQGKLRARKLLLCTNGYTDRLAPPLDKTVVPIRSIQVATVPLTDNIRRTILPGGHSASDSRRLLLYFRLDPQGRFIMGGRGAYDVAGTQYQMEALRKASLELYPQLGDTEWSYAWGGYVAMTADHYPHLNRVGPDIMAGMGYNGRGVAMGTAMGRVLADWASGTPEADLDFPVTDPQPIPFHFLRKPAVSATVAWYRLRDRLGV
jgi:glycine/D-amino acid oxidase-like deaminating enzyme